MFTESFGKFVCPGDTITCNVGKFTATATVYHDDNADKPDERSDGFWPSREPEAAGYVLPENFDAEQAKAEEIMRAWLNDEWHYSGVAVTVECADVELAGKYEFAVWGIERNYPGSDNSYLTMVANELVGEAIEAAKKKIAALTEGLS